MIFVVEDTSWKCIETVSKATNIIDKKKNERVTYINIETKRRQEIFQNDEKINTIKHVF